jgi:hypothetical protein
MGYVDDAFANLKSTLEITKTEADMASRRHSRIRERVRETWTLEDDFLTGSYRRDTKTKPLSDVDIFAVVNRSGPQAGLRKKSPESILHDLSDVLSPHFHRVSIDGMACVVEFGEDADVMSFDVVPAFKRTAKGGGYDIPDTRRGVWLATNPKTHHELSTAKNQACDERYVPFVKMVKGVNLELSRPVPQSFLLEVMALSLVKEPFGRYQDELRWFLATAVDSIHESWPDPAALGPDVNTMTTAQRGTASNAFAQALITAEEAIRLEDDNQERAAVESWRRLMGWRMPRP